MAILSPISAPQAAPAAFSPGKLLLERPLAVVALSLLVILSPTLFAQPAQTGDPVEYYSAARCVAEHLVCAAHDHWSARWPVFAPTGLLFALLGESRFTLGLAPLVHAFAAVLLFAAILQRTIGRRAALVGGLLFAATPLVSELALQINADMLELAFLFGATLALVEARRQDRAWLWLLAGALLALAVETRTTAVVPGAAIGIALLFLRWPWRSLMLVVAGGAAVLAASALAQVLITGDPFHAFRLALSHTQVPTTELPPGVDTTGGPFFNLNLIRNWSRQVAVHWTVDPVLNLIVNPTVGLTYASGALLLLIGRKGFRGGARDARALRLLGLSCAAFLVTISFILSIHPTPRMFLPVLAALVAMIAILISGPRTDLFKPVLIFLVPLLLLQSFALRLFTFDPIQAEQYAAEWLAQEEGPVATDSLTRRHLNQVPAVRALGEDEGGGAGLYLILAPGTCETSKRRGDGWSVRRSQPMERRTDGLVRFIDGLGLGLGSIDARPWSLCLYERHRSPAS